MVHAALAHQGPRPSAAAMTICVLIVAGAVLFGIFGPGIAQRSHLGGHSLGELVGAAASLRDQLLAASLAERGPGLRGEDDESATVQAAREAARSISRELLGRRIDPPDLAGAGFELSLARPVNLGSTKPNAVALGYLDRQRRAFLALFVLPDDGRFVLFDDFGRPVPLEPERSLIEPLDRFRNDPTAAFVWSSGPLLWIGIADSREDAEALRSALTAP